MYKKNRVKKFFKVTIQVLLLPMIFLFTIIIHEYGHALAIWKHGGQVLEIYFSFFEGHVRWTGNVSIAAYKDIAVAGAVFSAFILTMLTILSHKLKGYIIAWTCMALMVLQFCQFICPESFTDGYYLYSACTEIEASIYTILFGISTAILAILLLGYFAYGMSKKDVDLIIRNWKIKRMVKKAKNLIQK